MGKSTKRVEKSIVEGMKLRLQAKNMEDGAKLLKAEGNDLISPALAILELDKYSVEGVGTVSRVTRSTTHTDNGKVKEHLLLAGVDYEVIQKAFERAQTKKTSQTIMFKAK